MNNELRRKIMHGYSWTVEECRAVWQQLTGERIELGTVCPVCRCSGERYTDEPCDQCNGSGYSKRPTWMEESI